MAYYVYLLRCRGGSLYCGITTDLRRRLREHSGGRGGAKYTALNPPLGFEAAWEAPDRSSASRLEYRLKTLGHAKKEALVSGAGPEAEWLEPYRRVEISGDGRIEPEGAEF